MKTGIHPQYNVVAKVKCATCGTEFEFGSTLEGYNVAICKNCHPFYTGEQQVVVDTANKISSFNEKVSKAAEIKKRMVEIEAKRVEREKAKVGVISAGQKGTSLKDLLKAKEAKKK
jgi:large subunit ribosomal protein L31